MKQARPQWSRLFCLPVTDCMAQTPDARDDGGQGILFPMKRIERLLYSFKAKLACSKSSFDVSLTKASD